MGTVARDDHEATENRARRRLAIGAALGFALAVGSLLSSPDAERLPGDAVARVNATLIRAESFEQALAAVESDRRSPLSEADRRAVLDRMIEEELLVQYGLALGLARSDGRVRGDLVSAVIAAQVANADGHDPTPGELIAFYRENQDFFAQPGRLHVRTLRVAGPPVRDEQAARERAERASQRLRAGEDFDVVRRELGDPEVAGVPDTPLPPAKLREYVGPSITELASQLDVGAVSSPIAFAGGFTLIRLEDRTPATTPPAQAIAEELRREYQRRAGERALRATLDGLREDADVTVRAELP